MRAHRPHAIWVFAALASAPVVASCGGPSSVELLVDVQTDLVPGVEFASVQVQTGERLASVAAALGDDYAMGVRVAEIDGLEPGRHEVAVLLVDGGGAV